MIDFNDVLEILLGGSVVEQISNSQGIVLWSKAGDDPANSYFYVEDVSGSDNTLSIVKSSTSAPTIEVFKSTDGTNWESMGSTDTTAITATIPANGKLYLKATADTWSEYQFDYNSINASGAHNVGGNIMSLLYGDDFQEQTRFPSWNNYIFNNIFVNSNLVSAASLVLPVTELNDSCYYNMFQGCSSLTTAPELPATELAYECYYNMFQGCTSLTTAPSILPATRLSYSCYYGMFSGCSSLTTAPELPATELAYECYYNMFSGCSSLTTAPALPATILNDYCYRNMFNGCTSLTTAPALSATTLAYYCYSEMFFGCTALTTAPALPATTVAGSCYFQMFSGCTSLTQAPALPATTLDDYCYANMFSGCTSLTTAPELPATTLKSGCYNNMFFGCTALNSVTTYATDISATNCLNNWLNNVAATGDFYNKGNVNYDINSASGIPSGWTEHSIKTEYFYVEDISGSDNTLTIKKDNLAAPSIDFYVSTDKANWTRIGNPGTSGMTATIPANGKLYIKSVSDTWASGYSNIITASGAHNVGGNIMSLLYGDNFQGETEFPASSSHNFGALFRANTALVSAANLVLPATTLTDYCYQYMFRGCTSLTTAPELPATTLVRNCYFEMFNGCSSLNSVTTYAIDISATNCLNNWLNNVAATGDFYNLGDAEYTVDSASGIPTGWTEHLPDYSKEYFFIQDKSGADNTLSIKKKDYMAQTVTVYYSTDKINWTSIGNTSTAAITVTVPANSRLYLRANTARWGYASSTSYYNSITLNNDFIVGGNIQSLLYGSNYKGNNSVPTYAFPHLFTNNTKLLSAKRLILPKATGKNCYSDMFNGCTGLTEAPVLPATTLTDGCYGSMFEGCTSLTTAPALPATTLVKACYAYMFRNCTSLTQTPVLPATTLADSCYNIMFYGCTSLNKVITYATNIGRGYSSRWLYGVSSTGDFYNLGGASYTRDEDGIPSGWTVHTSL